MENFSQEQIDDLCFAAGWEVYKDENIQKLAELAVRETGMGNVEDKIKKHKVKKSTREYHSLYPYKGQPERSWFYDEPIYKKRQAV